MPGIISDQPGRILAVFVFAPILLFKGIKFRDLFIIVFAVLLFTWDLYWLIYKAPCERVISVDLQQK